MHVSIKYCGMWNYEPQAASLAATLDKAFDIDTELTAGSNGVFDVRVDDRLIYSKDETGSFPNDGEILDKIRADHVTDWESASADFLPRIINRTEGNAIRSDIASSDIAKYIDHTLLRPDATLDEITTLCQEATEFGFATVCVNPCYVRHCAGLLRGSSVKVCTVVGFPLGANTSATKTLETRQAIGEGAREIDMVINVGALKSGDDELVYQDIHAVVEACGDGGAICKVILETALLTDEETIRACRAARRAGADFVKTSTGFASGGATVADVALLAREVSAANLGIKASGGIRSWEDAQQMIRAGATRIGASAGVRIVKESQGAWKYPGQDSNLQHPV
jgi:deoxyribose-phosphate aldolase